MTEAVAVKAVPDRRSRRKQLLVVLLVVVLGALLLPKLLFGGDDNTEVELFPTAPPTTAGDDAESADLEPGPAPTARRAEKNPFEPLMAQGAAPESSATSEPSSIVPPEVQLEPEPLPIFLPPPEFEPAPAPAPPPPPPTTTVPPVGAPAPRIERNFALVEIYIDGTGLEAATVELDGKVYEVAVGQEFADHYRALALDADHDCGVFVYGARRFSICEGEERTT